MTDETSAQGRDDVVTMHPALAWVGQPAEWLRRNWLLAITVFVGATFTVIASTLLPPPIEWWEFALRIGAGVAAAAAVLLDKVADKYSATKAKIELAESDHETQVSIEAGERAAERALASVNIFLSEAIEASFLDGAAHREALVSLRRTLVRCAADAIGDGTRATYYVLSRNARNLRTLGAPEHHIIGDRKDKPERPFEEAADPDHEIWTLMDRPDEEQEIRVYPEKVGGVDWERKRYRTFYSTPVKAKRVQLGLLSVNNAVAGSIGGAQRDAVLAMARIMAHVLAEDAGPKEMKAEAQRTANRAAIIGAVSPVPTSVQASSKEGEA